MISSQRGIVMYHDYILESLKVRSFVIGRGFLLQIQGNYSPPEFQMLNIYIGTWETSMKGEAVPELIKFYLQLSKLDIAVVTSITGTLTRFLQEIAVLRAFTSVRSSVQVFREDVRVEHHVWEPVRLFNVRRRNGPCKWVLNAIVRSRVGILDTSYRYQFDALCFSAVQSGRKHLGYLWTFARCCVTDAPDW